MSIRQGKFREISGTGVICCACHNSKTMPVASLTSYKSIMAYSTNINILHTYLGSTTDIIPHQMKGTIQIVDQEPTSSKTVFDM
jgi:hypothetical protein